VFNVQLLGGTSHKYILFFLRWTNTEKRAVLSTFSRARVYIQNKKNIPHIPHISHVKNIQQKQDYVRDVRDVRDVFLVLHIIYIYVPKIPMKSRILVYLSWRGSW